MLRRAKWCITSRAKCMYTLKMSTTRRLPLLLSGIDFYFTFMFLLCIWCIDFSIARSRRFVRMRRRFLTEAGRSVPSWVRFCSFASVNFRVRRIRIIIITFRKVKSRADRSATFGHREKLTEPSTAIAYVHNLLRSCFINVGRFLWYNCHWNTRRIAEGTLYISYLPHRTTSFHRRCELNV